MRQLMMIFALVCATLSASAEPLIPDARIVISRDTDFPGNDIRSIFDTTLRACDRACQADPNCRAFTFNERSAACFPKSDVGEATPYEGAISAVLIPADPGAEATATARAAAYPTLSTQDIEAAHTLARNIGYRHAANGSSARALVTAAIGALGRNDRLSAYRLIGAGLSQSDASDQWAEYSRLAVQLGDATGNSSERRSYRATAISAAVNAYLRAPNDTAAATALVALSEAFQKSNRGRAMIPALRLAQSLSPRDEISARLDDAIGKYGFRVTETRVESDARMPRICAMFNEPLVKAGVDYDPFVQRDTSGLTVSAEGTQLCLDGVQHGERYRITLRPGLPSEAGETLIKPITLTHYVRDRAPSVRFPGRAYVLPKGGDTALPIVTVNLDTVDLALRRVSDRNLLRAIQDNFFGRSLSIYEDDQFASEIAEQIWSGTGDVTNTLNADVTTRLPLAEVIADLPAGIYALQARVPGADPYSVAAATQWFVVSDLGVATMQGADGLHVVTRSLATAGAVEGAVVTLVSRANAVLATARSDADGYARFDPALTRGRDGAAPALITVA